MRLILFIIFIVSATPLMGNVCDKRMVLPYFMPPVIDFYSHLMRETELIFKIDTEEKVIALTLDDGPSLRHNFMPAVLDILKKYSVPATFFVLSERIKTKAEMDLIQRAWNEGHDIQLHGWDQKETILDKSKEELILELEISKILINEAIGQDLGVMRSWLYRPAFGITNKRTREVIVDEGYQIILGDIVPTQYNIQTGKTEEPTNLVLKRINQSLSPGSIIVLHTGEDRRDGDRTWDSPCTAETLDVLIPDLQSRGYRFILLSDAY